MHFCVNLVLLWLLLKFYGTFKLLVTLENPMHVTSFQGRVACRFYPLEGFKHETEKHPPLCVTI